MTTATPKYATISDWQRISGMRRTSTYEALGRGNLLAIKLGTRNLIDAEAGLAWLASLPAADIHTGQLPPPTPSPNKDKRMLQQRSDNWLAERALIDAQLDPDLRHDVVTNLGQDTRCLLQIIRLLREAMQSAPAKR